MTAKTFCVAVPNAAAIDRALGDAKQGVRSPVAGLVFVAGALANEPETVADRVRVAWPGVPTIIVPAAGVMNERTELEGTGAAAGLLWTGGRAAPFVLGDDRDPTRDLPADLARASSVLLFTRPDAFQPQAIEGLGLAPHAVVLGAGTVAQAPIAIRADGKHTRADAIGMALGGLASPIVHASVAARLLTPFLPVDEVMSGLVLRLGGRPALDVLSGCAQRIQAEGAQPLVFAAVAEEPAEAPGKDRFVVRPIRGIDPDRKGVVVGPDAKPGARIAFAVRDASTGRTELEQSGKTVLDQAQGSSPRFLLYLTCAGRGQGLYGQPGVESRILKKRFGDLPMLGMMSSFEMVPRSPGQVRLAMYSGVIALFRSPS